MNLSMYKKIFFSHFSAIVLVVGCMGMYLYMLSMDNLLHSLQSRLLSSTALLSQSFDAHELSGLRQSRDKDKQVYHSNLKRLRDMMKSNPDIAYLYVMRRDKNKALFVLDSDTVAMSDIGEVDQLATPAMMEGFYLPSVDQKINSDQWGYFLSGYAPLKNGRGQYLIGIDMRADEVTEKLQEMRYAALIALLLALVVAWCFSMSLSRHFTRRINTLKKLFQEQEEVKVTGKRKGDELDQLLSMYQIISENRYQHTLQYDRSQKNLQDQLLHLKRHYKQHTQDLEQSNLKLREEVAQRADIERELAKVACTDELTGLMNRRAIMRICINLIKKYAQDPQPFCIMMIDISSFKDVNVKYGMAIADEILKQFTVFLKGYLSQKDSLARWSGSGFTLVLPSSEAEKALALSHEIHAALTHYHFHAGQVQLQVHFGVCVYRAAMEVDEAMNYAVSALMQAKQRGSYCSVYDEASARVV